METVADELPDIAGGNLHGWVPVGNSFFFSVRLKQLRRAIDVWVVKRLK